MSKNYMKQALLVKLGGIKEVLNKTKEFVSAKTEGMFVERAKEISYEEMMEMGSQGTKVIHPRAVEMAQHYGIPIFITNFEGKRGTLIH